MLRLALLASLLAACSDSRDEPQATSTGEENVSPHPAGPVPGGPTLGRCPDLAREPCLHRPDCTLELETPGSHYVCREARGSCELGLRQGDLEGTDLELARRTQADCNARSGCVYVPSQCYCACRGIGQTRVRDGEEAPVCNCECGGGAPATCAERPPPAAAES